MGLLGYLIGMLTLIANHKDDQYESLQKVVESQKSQIKDLTYKANMCKPLYVGY
jgi:hypothetical protein